MTRRTTRSGPDSNVGQEARTVAVIGAGTMGAGIAQTAARHGCNVFLTDVDHERLAVALAELSRNLDQLVEKGKLTGEEAAAVKARIRGVASPEEALGAELAVEAVVEDLAVKQEVFRRLELTLSLSAVLATNTSSLSVTRIAAAVKDPSRVVGMHFFNPAPVMPLVEIIAASPSSAETIQTAVRAARAWGKTTVIARDTPGFIVNRVARGYYLEALRLLGEGVAGVDEIDRLMRVHGGFKMGPFELMDLVGLDVNLAVSTSVWEQLGKPARLAPHPIQQQLVREGRFGRKTGRGFYHHDGERALPAYVSNRRAFTCSPLLAGAARAFCGGAGVERIGSTEAYIFTRILAAVINEAGFALAESVASREDIDLAMLKGVHYPHGPLAWADRIGPRTVLGALRLLNENASDGRYAPSDGFLGS